MNLELWILLRLLVAAILGGVVGYERASSGKRAGLRTHMLVAVGSTLFVSSSDMALDWARSAMPHDAPSTMQVQIAVLSPVQAIATGIGFLGAGTIFLGGHQQRVHGLTTAASIWVIAAIGIAVGCDRYLLATGALAPDARHLTRPDQVETAACIVGESKIRPLLMTEPRPRLNADEREHPFQNICKAIGWRGLTKGKAPKQAKSAGQFHREMRSTAIDSWVHTPQRFSKRRKNDRKIGDRKIVTSRAKPYRQSQAEEQNSCP